MQYYANHNDGPSMLSAGDKVLFTEQTDVQDIFIYPSSAVLNIE